MPAYFFNIECVIVQGDQRSYTVGPWVSTTGAPVDVSTWDVYFKAESIKTTDTIVIAPAAVIFKDSGSGTVDTFEIPMSESQTNIDPGYYRQEIAVDRGGVVNTIAKGTLTIVERLTEV